MNKEILKNGFEESKIFEKLNIEEKNEINQNKKIDFFLGSIIAKTKEFPIEDLKLKSISEDKKKNETESDFSFDEFGIYRFQRGQTIDEDFYGKNYQCLNINSGKLLSIKTV